MYDTLLKLDRATPFDSFHAPPRPSAAARMAPIIEAFPPWQLGQRVNLTTAGKTRKDPVDLEKCALKELVQYECQLKGPKENPRSVVVCAPIVRLFRR